MDNSGFGGGILPASVSGFLDLDASIQRASDLSRHHHHTRGTVAMGGPEICRLAGTLEPKATAKGVSVNCSRGKGVSAAAATASTVTVVGNKHIAGDDAEDDERSFTEDGNDVHFNGGKGKNESPWQRMKWTDKVVRLLIMAVSYVGDDAVPECVAGKRKSGSLQKKGKWKTVSRIMIEKGCYVSPQQCEDKFNDLNKRYKRLNEILGRGTSCQVVENPFLLDSISHLSPKIKEDVRKILSSKHLFYREMCAYHNGQRIPQLPELDLGGYSMPLPHYSEEGTGSGDDDKDEDENEDSSNDGEDEYDVNGDGDVERIVDFGKRKINGDSCSFVSESGRVHDSFGAEVAAAVHDTATKSNLEDQEWIRNRVLRLHEQRFSVQAQAFDLEKRRLEWQRFCGSKDRELERLWLENERFRIENERMALQLKKKEMEICFKRSEASIGAVAAAVDGIQGREQIDLGRVQ